MIHEVLKIGGLSMVNSLSAVTTGSNIGAMDKVTQEQLYSPGRYSQPIIIEAEPRYREKGSFLGFLGKTVVYLTLLGAAAIGGRKLLMKDYKVLDTLPEDSKAMAKVKNTFAKYTDILYDNTVAKIVKMVEHKKADVKTESKTKDKK